MLFNLHIYIVLWLRQVMKNGYTTFNPHPNKGGISPDPLHIFAT